MASLMDTRRRIMLNTPHLETLTDSLVTFDTDVPADLKEHKLYIEPIQDLHGYDNPWPAGGGKNVLPLTIDNLKSINTVATWNGNTCTLNDVSFAIGTDSDGNVTSITVNGTASNISYLILDGNFDSAKYESYRISGLPSNGDANSFVYRIASQDSWTSIKDYFTYEGSQIVNNGSNLRLAIRIARYYTASNIVFKPMIRKNTEDSTFAPYSNICPISGRTSVGVVRCGKNLLNADLISGYYSNTSFNIVNTTSTIFKSFKVFLKSGTYTLSFGVACNIVRRIANNSIVMNVMSNDTSYSFTVQEDGYVGFSFRNHENTYWDSMVKIQLELGSTATPYEPYQGESYDIDFPSEAGTVYGGTLDVKTGELVVDRAMVDMGTLDWVYRGPSGPDIFSYVPSQNLYRLADDVKAICSYYPYVGTILALSVVTSKKDKSISLYFNKASSSRTIYIKDSSFAGDAAALKTALSGQTLVYELATPITYQLTPHTLKALRGVNNIWSSESTNTQVRFWTHKKED